MLELDKKGGYHMSILENKEIVKLTKLLNENHENRSYLVSDIILEENGKEYQFVDLVLEGGGTLGIALVGYIYALEQAGIRFLSVGGSSVGAIVSTILASFGDITEEKGKKLTNIVSTMDMGSFVDGSYFPRKLSHYLGAEGDKSKLKIGALSVLSLPALFKRLGLNPGNEFFEWFSACLKEENIYSTEDIEKILAKVPSDLIHRSKGKDFRYPKPKLKVVAADLTTTTKTVFPEMADLYWEDPSVVNPAHYVRASMSIPFFFEPMNITKVSEIKDVKQRWKRVANFYGNIPDKVLFTDGGMISNFPISIFHLNGVPNAPTLGVRLGTNVRNFCSIASMVGYISSVISSLRFDSDYEFIYKNPDYNKLIAYIDTRGHNWLNFAMSDTEKEELFIKGMLTALDFLENFDWEGYKKIRKEGLEYYIL